MAKKKKPQKTRAPRTFTIDSLNGMYSNAKAGKSSYAALFTPELKSLYFGASIDVPEGALLGDRVKLLKGKSKKDHKFIDAMLAQAYREGYKKGEDKAAERAKESAHGTLRANERNMRNANRVVAEAITLLSNVLRNNEVYGRDTDGGVLTVCD